MKGIKTIPNATHIKLNDDGTTSNGSIFSNIDRRNFYLDHIKYTIEEGVLYPHLAAKKVVRTSFFIVLARRNVVKV
ncbi:MAG: hypothetical protein J1F13_06180 [Prevotellaceae bacterium]|nr:hypothetical protein [Prevotellaceae bacterium]